MNEEIWRRQLREAAEKALAERAREEQRRQVADLLKSWQGQPEIKNIPQGK